MSDKAIELSSKISLINNRLHFSGEVDSNDPISIDYTPPLGDNLGYTSLELLLLSLSSCLGSAILVFLRKMGKEIHHFEIHSRGIRKHEHPLAFSLIQMNIDITSGNLTDADMKKVIAMAEDKYCPVWSMLKGNVNLEIEYTIK